MNIEAMKRWLEALDSENPDIQLRAAISLRQAIEQAQSVVNQSLTTEQKPVAWMFQHEETGRMNYVSNDGMNTPELFLKMNPRYVFVCPLYTSPPQRQPLTDEEIETISAKIERSDFFDCIIPFARAIEAAHNIKGDV